MPAISTVPDGRAIAFSCHPHRQRRFPAQPRRHAGGELLVHVLDDDDGRRESPRGDRRSTEASTAGPPADASDDDERFASRFGRGAPAAVGGAVAVLHADQTADRGDLDEQRRGGTGEARRVRPAACRRRRARRCPIASNTRAVLARTLSVTTRMAHGQPAMMRRVASTPSIPAPDQVHQDRSGVSFAQSATASSPVRAIQAISIPGLSASAARSLRSDSPTRVDDADPHASASPIRSTTACSSVSSWKLPLVR